MIIVETFFTVAHNGSQIGKGHILGLISKTKLQILYLSKTLKRSHFCGWCLFAVIERRVSNQNLIK